MEKADKWWMKIIIIAIFTGIVAVTAEVDWAAEHSGVGLGVRFTWLIGLILLGIILPILFMYLAGNIYVERKASDKKWFIITLAIFACANGIPPVFYVVLGQAPGFFLYVQLTLFGLVPAFIFQPKGIKTRLGILTLLFLIIILPLGLLVNITIDLLWSNPMIDKTLYYLFFWGLLSVFLYFIIAIGWKFGGGSRRQSWNVFISGMLMQYSTLEDFFYFLLNGQFLPGSWPWMSNFVINLQALFGHVPTDLDLLVFCLITVTIAIFILFDGHGYIWKVLRKK
jgi:hypothetical protein